MSRTLPAVLLVVPIIMPARFATARDAPEDLASRARITASSRVSDRYDPANVADGAVPAADGRNDIGRAWCVDGSRERDGGWLRLEWVEPIEVAEIVYYGRTAWMLTECWRDYEVLAEGSGDPIARGRFEMLHGPQRIEVPPTRTNALTLRFLSSWGGMNPGASAVQVFGAPAPDSALLVQPMRRPRPSPELAARLASGDFGFSRLVVVERYAIEPSHVYTYHNEGFRPGGGLCLVELDEVAPRFERLVDASSGQILDCELSWDGHEILFSWRRTEEDTYHVWRIGVDGSGLTALTNGPDHDFNACWLPDGDIAFLSTRKPAFAYCWTSPVGVLHRMDRDGGGVRRISANYLNDFTPSVLDDGQIIYGRWEYVDRPAIPIQSLWTIRPDGTGLSVFYGNRVLSPATFIEPRAIPGSSAILCTMTAHNGPCRGAIGIIDPSHGVNAQASIRNLTPEVDIGRVDRGDGNGVRGPYESPFPIDEGYYLVSRAGSLLLRDYDGTEEAVVAAPRSGMGFYSPRPLLSRDVPPVRVSRLERDSGPWATVFVRDVYHGLEPHVARGEVRQIAVVQEIEKSELADVRYRAFGFQFPVVSCGATYAPKKVWGYADVAPDGSAAFRVPAGVPIYFLALDAEGRAVQRMRSFTHLMPGETRGCTGCHSSSTEGAPPQSAGAPVGHDVAELTPPEWGVDGFSYARIVQPVLDRHCLGCHEGPRAAGDVDLSGDLTDFFSVSYETLAREGPRPGANRFTSWIPTFNGCEKNILEVTPKSWGSPASRLADLVLSGHPDEDGRARVRMPPVDSRRIFTWIDLNVPYYGTSGTRHPERTGCRQLMPPDLERTIADVAARRCVPCHSPDREGSVRIPRKPWVRITRPEWNDFLVAPRAREAGGTEACGRAVFESTDDPDYRAILRCFEPIRALLEENPRTDILAREGK